MFDVNQRDSRIGEKSIATNGMIMEIIEYIDNKDITVKFEDGTIVKHTNYKAFKEGFIRNKNTFFGKHIGESRIANNGQSMKIIRYGGYYDVDIKFEDGTVVYKRKYENFVRGKITNPNFSGKLLINRIGEVGISLSGLIMTIIDYKGANNVTIKFDDGTIVENIKYERFQLGRVVNPNNRKFKGISLPEVVLLYYLRDYGFKKYPQGYFLRYNKKFGNKEIDLFNEKFRIGIEYDGYFYHKNTVNKDEYKNNVCEESNIDLIRIREAGLPKLNNSYSYIIDRKDNYNLNELKEILYSIIYYLNKNFELNINIFVDIERDYNDIIKFYKDLMGNFYKDRIGEKIKAKNGMYMTIIEYISPDNVTVEFEDGYITNTRYRTFLSGYVRNPNITFRGKDRTGETNIAKNGYKMTIKNYRNTADIDVEFEDGYISYNKSYQSFKNGTIRHPNRLGNFRDRTGEVSISKSGLKMKIIEYYNTNNVTVEFEDGVIVYNKAYQNFKNGRIGRS